MKIAGKIILLIAGIFSFFLALSSLASYSDLGLIGMIVMFLLFGLISFVCFFFSRSLFIKSYRHSENLIKSNYSLKQENERLKAEKSVLENDLKEQEFEKQKRLNELDGQITALNEEKDLLESKTQSYRKQMRDEKNKTLATIGNYKRDFSLITIDKIDNMEGIEFEKFIEKLLKDLKYKNVKRTPDSNDFGVDVIAEKNGVKYAIQCKNYTADIGNKAVQEAYSGKQYYNCHVGVVITNRFFTRQAKELAEKNDILLWDRNKLKSMIKKV